MKAAVVLLSDHQTQNTARRMVFELSQIGDVKFFGSPLPAHVSLKQTFVFESMNALETWFDSFSRRVAPFRIDLDHVYYGEWEDQAIVGFSVYETPALRELHNQLNRELKDVVLDPSAPHDGDEYRFHLTVELGRVGETNPFRQFYDSLPEKHLGMSFMAEHIALFIYADGPIEPGSFFCYKVLPLTGK